ncbi:MULTISPECIES: hypothetical protein [Bacillus]|uniref:hypothetical protein n=1 Tax=Bacillus TaxID=1386 RepID=UPI00149046DA|nr:MULTISPECIES: hypothetical protein [Bacillus]MBE0185953.1 hypothetical protein [Bacillus subtilis]MEC2277059.1 hypothetical protein [Bacillus subtilis]NOV05921.1 hypothetical protein [Bacillus sp. seq1]
MIKTNLHSNYVDEIIGEYYAAKGYSVQSIDRQENGHLILEMENINEDKVNKELDIPFNFIHKRPHRSKLVI